MWKEASLHSLCSFLGPGSAAAGPPSQTKAGGTTSPSLPRSSGREKAIGSSMSAWSGATGANFAQQGCDKVREGGELSNDNQDLHELCLNNAVGKNIIVIAHNFL